LEHTQDTVNGYQVDATIQHRSNIASATLHYSIDTAAGYQSTSMSLVNPSTDEWSGLIPPQSAGETVYYYIEATANSGKQRCRPMPAPEGYWEFDVTGATSLRDHTQEANFEVYPNPADAITCVDLQVPVATKGRVELRSIEGRLIERLHQGEIPQGEPQYFFDAGELAPGIYLLVLRTEMGRRVKKLSVR
jgi:hypothetical protein